MGRQVIEGEKDRLQAILALMLRPVVRFALRRALKLQDLITALKRVLYEEAKREMDKQEHKINVSRLSMMTGLHRQDVSSLIKDGSESSLTGDVLTRIIGQWQNDKRFRGPDGEPRMLKCEGKQSEFVELVRSVSKDPNPYTVMFELERNDMVTRSFEGLKLKADVFLSKDALHSFEILANDTDDLTRAVETNVLGKPSIPHLHIRTAYDNISKDSLPKIRKWILREGTEFQKRIREYLSSYDLDINPDLENVDGGEFVSVGIFSFDSHDTSESLGD